MRKLISILLVLLVTACTTLYFVGSKDITVHVPSDIKLKYIDKDESPIIKIDSIFADSLKTRIK